jgi:uncharacterized protein YegJ (DUF2314 family)
MARFFAAAVVFALAACAPADDDDAARERKLQRDIAAARKEARAQLPFFWEHFSVPLPAEYDFMLKVALPHRDGTRGEEVIWVDQIAREDEGFSGQLAADPTSLGDLTKGAVVAFTEPMIADWAFFQGEQLLGHYTTRVMLPRLDPEQAEGLRSLLGENPD